VHAHGRAVVDSYHAENFGAAVNYLMQMEQASNRVIEQLELFAQQGEGQGCAV
jgi:hypothetical protein